MMGKDHKPGTIQITEPGAGMDRWATADTTLASRNGNMANPSGELRNRHTGIKRIDNTRYDTTE